MCPLERACIHIVEAHGTCPNDMYNFKVSGGCELMCDSRTDSIYLCWMEYFNSVRDL